MLPTAEALLMSEVEKHEQKTIELQRQRAKLYHDKVAKTLPDLTIGHPPWVQQVKGCSWRMATTVNVLGNRSYMVQTEDGQLYRRNRKLNRLAEQQNSPMMTPEPHIEPENQTLNRHDDDEMPNQCVDVTDAPAEDTGTMKPPRIEQTVTSSGRIVNLPDRLKDYVKH